MGDGVKNPLSSPAPEEVVSGNMESFFMPRHSHSNAANVTIIMSRGKGDVLSVHKQTPSLSTGAIPEEFSNLGVLEVLDLFENHLSGESFIDTGTVITNI